MLSKLCFFASENLKLNLSFMFLVLYFCVSVEVNAEKFNANKHVYYEMHCRSSNFSTNLTLNDIDLNVLDNENFILDDKNSNRTINGVKNCRWNWNPNRPTRFFVHGYYSSRDTFMDYAKVYLEASDYNFIAINWLKGAKTLDYTKAKRRVREVGEALARFIDYLVTLGLNLNELILVGHSLGAHICGIAGKNVKSGKVAVIVGLDPALPLFSLKKEEHRLAYSDANYVQIIHTSGGFLGVKHPIGHADFYPNFGCAQPGCGGPIVSEVCSHTRVHSLYQESLKKDSQFWAMKCASYGEIYDGKCSHSGPMARMGGDIENMELAFGLYYLQTNDKPPYSMVQHIFSP